MKCSTPSGSTYLATCDTGILPVLTTHARARCPCHLQSFHGWGKLASQFSNASLEITALPILAPNSPFELCLQSYPLYIHTMSSCPTTTSPTSIIRESN